MKHLNDNELVMAMDGELEDAELKGTVDHLAECDQCRERWEKLQELSARVAEYSRSLYDEPLAADERRSTLIENPKVFESPAWSWGWAAAAVLAGLSVVAYWNSHSSRTERAQNGALEVHSGAPDVAGNHKSTVGSFVAEKAPQDYKTIDSKVTQQAASPSRSARAVRLRLRAHPAVMIKTPSVTKPEAQLAQFTELPFSDAALPLDQATVVRVALPAGALRQAGVPIEEDNAGAMLQADVVLGVDGLPRGIRLVKNTVANLAGTN